MYGGTLYSVTQKLSLNNLKQDPLEIQGMVSLQVGTESVQERYFEPAHGIMVLIT